MYRMAKGEIEIKSTTRQPKLLNDFGFGYGGYFNNLGIN
jgi:hypothetical protein